MTKVDILAQLWLRYKPNFPRLVAGEVTGNDEFWAEFFAYNDVGLPLAYLSSENICALDSDGDKYIEETWDLLCKYLGVDSDEDYPDLETMFLSSPYVRFEDS